ncbi:MAG: hypothetical protein ACI9W6_000730, partial [Motiliproteus sp.]
KNLRATIFQSKSQKTARGRLGYEIAGIAGIAGIASQPTG